MFDAHFSGFLSDRTQYGYLLMQATGPTIPQNTVSPSILIDLKASEPPHINQTLDIETPWDNPELV